LRIAKQNLSSIIQTLLQYAQYIENGDDISQHDAIHKVTNGLRNVEALREIRAVLERGTFELVVSRNNFLEVKAKQDPELLVWMHDLISLWASVMDSYEGGNAFTGKGAEILKKLDHKRLGFLSAKDKELLLDAVMFECDTFLTMEERLSKNAKAINRFLGIRVIRPFEHWGMLRPFAALWL
jgi:hypothetical protein